MNRRWALVASLSVALWAVVSWLPAAPGTAAPRTPHTFLPAGVAPIFTAEASVLRDWSGLASRPSLRLPEGPLPPRTGEQPETMDLSYLKGDRMPAGSNVEALPSHWDWREHGVNTRVQNQGACGACYSFAALANFESRLQIQQAGSFDFSENNLKSCVWEAVNGWRDPLNHPWGNCGGANYQQVVNFLSRNGTVLEACDPYAPRDTSCKSTCPYQKTLLEWLLINGGLTPDPNVLKAYIQQWGPVYTTINAGRRDDSGNCLDGDWCKEFSDYRGDKTLYFPCAPDLGTNHAVLIVGWDDGLQHGGGTGAWIAKNSWGTDWGGTCGVGSSRGYFTIAYGSANIGFKSSTISGWQNYDPRGGLLAWDDAGWNSAIGFDNGTWPTAYELSKFVPNKNTRATRVEFWTTDRTTDVGIYIYGTFDGSRASDLLWQQQGLSFAEAGYHSIAINPPMQLANGNDVVVVVKVTNANATGPIACDARGPADAQVTYASKTGSDGSWLDLSTTAFGNLGVRLRTSDPSPVATPTSTLVPTRTNTPTKTPTFRVFTPSRWIRLPIILRNAYLSPVVPPTPNGQPTSTRTRTPVGPTPTRTATVPVQVTPTPTRPSGSGYILDDTVPMEWVDTGAGVAIPGGDDWCRGSCPFGFTFNFYGVGYTKFWVNTNGMVLFTASNAEPDGGDSWINTYVPNRAVPNNMAALFWDDLKPISGAVMRYQTFDSAPNRYLVVEWNNVGRYDDFDHPMTFEAIFYEGSNDIKFQYLAVSANSQGSGTSATIGLENANGTAGIQYGYNQAVVRDGLAILFRYAAQ